MVLVVRRDGLIFVTRDINDAFIMRQRGTYPFLDYKNSLRVKIRVQEEDSAGLQGYILKVAERAKSLVWA